MRRLVLPTVFFLILLPGCGYTVEKEPDPGKIVQAAGGVINNGKVDFSYVKLDNKKLQEIAVALGKVKNVSELILEGTSISDGASGILIDIPWLRSLDLSRTSITDAEVENLLKLKDLEYLYLVNTKLTDKALKSIAGLKRLIGLDLSGTDVKGEGFVSFADHECLSTLFLNRTSITSEGASLIAAIKPLRRLIVPFTKLEFSDLVKFTGMKNLTFLDVSGHKLTDDEKRTLREKKPKLVVDFGLSRAPK